jgi:hypothetical protein
MTELTRIAGARSHPLVPASWVTGRTEPSFSASTQYGRLCPADPPTVEEIVAVVRPAGDESPQLQAAGVARRALARGLRVQEVPALGERDLDPRRGSLLVRHGKGGRRREMGMDAWLGTAAAVACRPR